MIFAIAAAACLLAVNALLGSSFALLASFGMFHAVATAKPRENQIAGLACCVFLAAVTFLNAALMFRFANPVLRGEVSHMSPVSRRLGLLANAGCVVLGFILCWLQEPYYFLFGFPIESVLLSAYGLVNGSMIATADWTEKIATRWARRSPEKPAPMKANRGVDWEVIGTAALAGLLLMVLFIGMGATSPEPSDSPAWVHWLGGSLPGRVLLFILCFPCFPPLLVTMPLFGLLSADLGFLVSDWAWEASFWIVTCMVQMAIFGGAAWGIAVAVQWWKS